MTFEIQQNEFSFTSSQLSPSNTASYIKWTKDCGSLSSAIDVPPTPQTFTIAPSDLGLTEFTTGIYTFTLYNAVGSSLIEETVCFYFEKAGECKFQQYYIDKDFDKIMTHLALQSSVNCGYCACQDLCDLYTNLNGGDTTCGTCSCTL